MTQLARAQREFGPKWHSVDKNGRRYKMPGLSELQIAALACVRDDIVTRYERRVGYERYIAYAAEGHDGSKLFRLSSFAIDVLAKYPEY